MSLVVNILESLDLAYLEKEEHLVDLEMLKVGELITILKTHVNV